MHPTRRALLAATAAAFALPRPSHATAATTSGRLVAWFANPNQWTTQAAAEAALRAMNTDAVTIGSRLSPVDRTGRRRDRPQFTSLPEPVRRLVGSRQCWLYGADFTCTDAPAGSTRLRVGSTAWLCWPVAGGVVLTHAPATGWDRTALLVQAGRRLGAKVCVGLPRAAIADPSGRDPRPDTSYLSALVAFTGMFARQQRRNGAAGLYQGFEMTVSAAAYWNSTRSLYRAQNQAVASVWPSADVLVSPYMSSRRGSVAPKTVADTASGLHALAATAAGTRLWVSPQDGLGTDSMAPSWEPHAEWLDTLEHYLAAARQAVGPRLYVTTEAFRNNRATSNTSDRLPTTSARVARQLATAAPYARGSIGYMWNEVMADKAALSGSRLGLRSRGAGFGHLFA